VIATRRVSEPQRRWDGQAYRRDMDRTAVAGEGRATHEGPATLAMGRAPYIARRRSE